MAKKILIADDEPHIVKLLGSRLKANNYEVIGAYDGVQAVEAAHREKPDLIILDIRMPAGGGLTVCENLKTALKTTFIPIILITAHPSDEIRQQAKELGADDFVTKPFNADELLVKVRKALGEDKKEDDATIG